VRAIFELDRSFDRETLGSISGLLLDEIEGVAASIDDWLLGERVRVENRLRMLHEKKLEQTLAEGVSDSARVAAARSSLDFDSTDERAWYVLIKALVDIGDRLQARKEYEKCREVLRRVLDVSPSREIVALEKTIRAIS